MGLIYSGVPKELTLSLRDKKGIKVFVETGTYMGETTVWASEHFKKVYSIEAAESIYLKTKEKLKDYSNITLIFGESNKELGKIPINEPALFWLDAHYSAGETFNGEVPLIEELKVINNLDIDSYIFIDDSRFITAKWLGEQYCELADLINILSVKKRYIAIFEDVIIAVPYEAKELVNEYANNMSQKYWADFLNRPGTGKSEPGNSLIRRAYNKIFK